MSKLKIPFTPVQLGLCLLNGAGLIFCVGGDLFLLMFDRGTVNRAVVMTNLALSVLTIAVCGALILRAGEFDLFDEGESGDRTPAIVALRTYFCMLMSDVTGVLILMLAGALVWKGAGRVIPIYAVLMFAAAGGLYYWRTSRMGLREGDEKPGEQEKSSETVEEMLERVGLIVAPPNEGESAESSAEGAEEDETHETAEERPATMAERYIMIEIEPARTAESALEQLEKVGLGVPASDDGEDGETSDDGEETPEIAGEQADNDDNEAAAEELSADTDKE